MASTGYMADAVQQMLLTGSPTGGSFTLSFGGQTTTALAFNATAATVQAGVQSLSSIGSGNALVSGPAGGPWQVRFAGSLAGMPEVEMTGNGSALTGGTNPAVSIGTTSQGGDTGRVQATTDPRGLISKTDYDLLGRTLRTIQNFVVFAPSNSADQTTQYTYDGSNHIQTLSAVLPGYVLETTTYSYGVTGSIISSNDLLASVAYPSETQTDSYSYDALGETLTHTDRNGTTHSYFYDILGRQTADYVAAFGAGVDQSVIEIDTAYDAGGRPYLFTSISGYLRGQPIYANQVEDIYNGLGQLITEYQSFSGGVKTTTLGVQYAYSFVSTSGGPNHSRLVSMTYPNGRIVNYNYNSGVDDRISRLSSISDSSATLEAYTYLGLNTVVTRSHPQTGINQTYIIPGGNPDGGDQNTGLDRFGRIVEQKWLNPGSGTATDDFQYSYDRDGNRTATTYGLNSSFNEQFGYDNLNRLTGYSRGGGVLLVQGWNLDAVGNWTSFTTNGSTQTRTFNSQNQLTSISGATTPTYDANGNTTLDDNGTQYTFDAWNRLVKAVAGSTTMAYLYDALGRRTVTMQNTNPAVDAYFSSSWQVLEQDQQSAVQNQFVWSSVYVDALVEQDTGSTRWYAQQDANWNVTVMLNSNGTVANRFVYDPYGKGNVYDANWNLQGALLGGLGSNWNYFFQGGRFDPITGLYNFRNRDYSPTLGRWIQEDPVGYGVGDNNLFLDERSDPTNSTDPVGLVGVPRGHHWVTIEALRDYFDYFSSEARTVLMGSTSGYLGPGNHNVSGGVGHDLYNSIVEQNLKDFLVNRGVAKRLSDGTLEPIGQLDAEQMAKFVQNIRDGKNWDGSFNKTLAAFNNGIKKLAARCGSHENLYGSLLNDINSLEKKGEALARNSLFLNRWNAMGVLGALATLVLPNPTGAAQAMGDKFFLAGMRNLRQGNVGGAIDQFFGLSTTDNFYLDLAQQAGIGSANAFKSAFYSALYQAEARAQQLVK